MSVVQAPWLTQTKCIPPRLREDLIPRQRLLDGLHMANLADPANEARRVMSALINETLMHLGESWVVLDDLHLITEPAIFSVLDYWLERMPLQMHLIVATRLDPPLVLARLCAHGQLPDRRVPNLRFTTDQTRNFLNNKQRLGLSADGLMQLHSRAGGWAAGSHSSIDEGELVQVRPTTRCSRPRLPAWIAGYRS